MRKLLKRIFICALAACCFYCGSIFADRQKLDAEWIRLHVVANSDSPEDQAVKLRVRDVVLDSLGTALENGFSAREAEAYLSTHLDQIQCAANSVLEAMGVEDRAVVRLCREAFETRSTEGVTLPAGIYQALRVTIGQGQGHNWWGVLFPELCGAGTQSSPVSLVETVRGEQEGNIRFFLLEKLGQLENYLRGR